ncbi:MAG: hypothetical protein KAX18_15125, partial [Candidatus Lokiarchaeota archaeon]|nr:hypothetical protein [Candidatus Lokiarchaeota archaeon]
SMNYYFEISSDWARGNKEMLMLSIIINQQISPEIAEIISLLCKKFANEIQSNRHIFTGLSINELSNHNENLIKTWVKNLYWEIRMKVENPLVLVIAEPDILNLSNRDYKLKGYKVITSTDTIEALDIIEERYNEISMVLIDAMMPHRGDYTLLDEIKDNEKYKDIYIRSFSKSGGTIYYIKDGFIVSKDLGLKYPKYSQVFKNLTQTDSRYRDWSIN